MTIEQNIEGTKTPSLVILNMGNLLMNVRTLYNVDYMT
jgi:hypothetical protein